MRWTKERIDAIPEVYRDFMRVLKPVIDTREEVLQVTGVDLGTVFSALRREYAYEPSQVRTIADNLKRAGFVDENNLGFLKPTAKGEDLLAAITAGDEPVLVAVPPLPDDLVG